MTSNTDSAGDDPDSAPMDAEDYPDTAAGTSHGGGDAETELVPPATAAAPEHAWSNEEPITEALSRPWRSVWAIAGIGLLCAVVVAFAIFGVVEAVRKSRGGAQTAPITPTHSVSVPAPEAPAPSPQAAATPAAPAAPRAARPDDDEFVALALSPRGLDSARHGGFGTSGTQGDANRIALSECRAASGNDDCLLVNAGMFHGCVSYAIDGSRRNWASGSGADADAARADALRRLGGPASFAYAQCSDPPGIIRSGSAAAAPSSPSTTTVTVQAAPEPAADPSASDNDEAFVAALRRAQIIFPSDSRAVRAAHYVCEQLGVGRTKASVIDEVGRSNPGLSGLGATDFVADSVVYYCPQYR